MTVPTCFVARRFAGTIDFVFFAVELMRPEHSDNRASARAASAAGLHANPEPGRNSSAEDA